jgi:hypothetical protein
LSLKVFLVTNQPQFITLTNIECISTDDLTGDDQLIGRFGNLQANDFAIGQFNSAPGIKVALNIEKIVPIGITVLQIIEQDLTGDDLIGTLDLTKNMSVENEVTLRNDSAVYILRYIVAEGN